MRKSQILAWVKFLAPAARIRTLLGTLFASVNRLRSCGSATQQSFSAEVLINIRPVNAVPGSTDFPICTLLWRRVQKRWVPCKRDDNRSAIHQINRQRVFSKMNVLDAFAGLNVRTVHTISPRGSLRFPSICAESSGVRLD